VDIFEYLRKKGGIPRYDVQPGLLNGYWLRFSLYGFEMFPMPVELTEHSLLVGRFARFRQQVQTHAVRLDYTRLEGEPFDNIVSWLSGQDGCWNFVIEPMPNFVKRYCHFTLENPTAAVAMKLKWQ
jgi:hypothetical protein